MSIRSSRVVVSCVVMLLISGAVSAQTSYTTLLLPVTPSDVTGQDGARWLTELTIANAGFDPANLFCFTGTCAPIAERSVQRIETPPRTNVTPGLMYVPIEDARRITASLRSRNSTPNSDERDFVSEIPVVREEEFRSSIIELTAVPIEANYRHMLRVYDANANEEAEVRVRIYGMMNGAIVTDALVDTTMVLRTPRGSASPYAMPDEPSWNAFPGFSDQAGIRNYGEVHIRIESLEDDTNLWAFVTATNNTTQRFAVYTP